MKTTTLKLMRLCALTILIGLGCFILYCSADVSAAGGSGSCFATPQRALRSFLLPETKNLISIEPVPDEVRFEELSKGLPKGRWTLIDCRNATELEDPGMIPGSYNIPLHEAVVAFKLTEQEFFERYGFKKPDPGNDRIVVSCRSGKRAEEFISKIRPLGYDNFKLYKGSFLDWIDRGGPVISKKPEKLQQQQPPQQQQQRVIQ